ncbi:hypothetical protein [Paenibacillus xylaniclasticus]|uniref:hypothetical protein n=1 Tax=Paenibacillus xylaniclasticus TaxID=588083 RepID=UPI000FDADB99|nr:MULTISPECIES: hypothetical protein [Paenibacillus]GFN30373.1 hypothetical protein PCURB6_06330 [Paenibacillus curdlanolyticus]
MTELKNGVPLKFYRNADKRNDRSRIVTALDDTLRLCNVKMNKEWTTSVPEGQVLADIEEA